LEEGRIELEGRSEQESAMGQRSEQESAMGQRSEQESNMGQTAPWGTCVDYQLVAVVSCVFGGSESDWRDGEAEDGKP